jgi:hypothetical protein
MEKLSRNNELFACDCPETTLGYPRSCCGGKVIEFSIKTANQKPDKSGTMEDNDGTIDTTI